MSYPLVQRSSDYLEPLHQELRETQPLAPLGGERSNRVIFAVGLVLALGLLDLVLTHWQMSTVGMFESNPLARWLVRTTGSAAPLIPFKLGSLMLGTGILLAFRRRGVAELSAWVVAGAHGYMAVVWALYLSAMAYVPEGLNGDSELFVRAS